MNVISRCHLQLQLWLRSWCSWIRRLLLVLLLPRCWLRLLLLLLLTKPCRMWLLLEGSLGGKLPHAKVRCAAVAATLGAS